MRKAQFLGFHVTLGGAAPDDNARKRNCNKRRETDGLTLWTGNYESPRMTIKLLPGISAPSEIPQAAQSIHKGSGRRTEEPFPPSSSLIFQTCQKEAPCLTGRHSASARFLAFLRPPPLALGLGLRNPGSRGTDTKWEDYSCQRARSKNRMTPNK